MKTTRVLFCLAGLYDGILGLAFLLLSPSIYRWCAITPPNHYGYVEFPAALLIVFALMFFAVASDPVGNRNLIPYGILLKASYCTIVFLYWARSGLPDLWKPFAVFDAAWGLYFAWEWRRLENASSRMKAESPAPD